ncbi:uncharacterized protein LOC142493868 [Ascaphus truei]|uniref:uncharacterized protein LOC142493868 n=1 Tax=Ascaphus truei TaxID=8439 RepID=UPI003F5971F5
MISLGTVTEQVRKLPLLDNAQVQDHFYDHDQTWRRILYATEQDICPEALPHILLLPEAPGVRCPLVQADTSAPLATSTPRREYAPTTGAATGGPDHFPDSGLHPRWPATLSLGSSSTPSGLRAGLNRLSVSRLDAYPAVGDSLPGDTSIPAIAAAIHNTTQSLQYRKLKAFSGEKPTPPGEVGIEDWLDHTEQVLPEWTCTDAVRRQRIVECLRPPASHMVHYYRDDNPEADAADLIYCLTKAYGAPVDTYTLMSKFHALTQKEGEMVSDFLRRLHLDLWNLVRKGVLPRIEANGLRTTQLLRGLLPLHPVSVRVSSCLTPGQALSFHDLMDRVQAHETVLLGRDLATGKKPQLGGKEAKKVEPKTDAPESGDPDPEDAPTPVTPRPRPPTRRSPPTRRDEAYLSQIQCYACGKMGHLRAHCPTSRRTSSRPAHSMPCQPLKDDQASPPPQGSRIGPASIIRVVIEGIYAAALLDTGSQVTIVYRPFYDQHLHQLPLLSADALRLRGLSHEDYPIDGVVKVQLDILQLNTGKHHPMEVEALVCPEPQDHPSAPIILGTNADIVRAVFRQFLQEAGEAPLLALAACPALQEVCGKIATEEEHGVLYSQEWGLTQIPPGEGRMMVAACHYPRRRSEDQLFTLESVAQDEQRLGYKVLTSVKEWPGKIPKRTWVYVQNISPYPMTIDRRQTLGRIYPVTSEEEASTELARSSPATIAPALEFDFGDSPLPDEWRKRLQDELHDRRGVFSTGDMDVGCSRSAHHTIRLSDATPFRERSRRLASKDADEVRGLIDEMKTAGIVRESRSPYASPIVVVRKKNGTVRLCVDYRTLNNRTIPDQYTLPRIEDLLNALTGSKWFSVLDLRSGYYQVPMGPEDQEKTAFICPLGFYQFTRMPQGICGAPATFQRLMEKTLGDLNPRECLVYLDDIIVFGRTLEEHSERLMKVLDRLEGEGLKLSLDKCKFCRTSVTYVGHIVSADGVSTDPGKIEAVMNWPRPQNVQELRSFLGFCGYYRRFVEGYSSKAKRLNDLLKVPPGETGRKGSSAQTPFGKTWTAECEQAFKHLKTSLTQAPVLAYADPERDYVLHVDASLSGLGAVLHQKYETGLRPVAYASRSLTPSEQNYPVHKLEFLALKWAVVDKLHDYLYGVQFEVRTDNNPMTYINTSAKLDATGHRWLAALANYRFNLKYKPGPTNIGADALSRRPGLQSTPDEEVWEEIPGPGIRALCSVAAVVDDHVAFSELRIVDSLGCNSRAIPLAYQGREGMNITEDNIISWRDLVHYQTQDPIVELARQAVQQDNPSILKRAPGDLVKLLLNEFGKFEMDNCLLYRVISYHNHPDRRQLFLPERLRTLVLRALHDDHGHLGIDKTFGLLQDRFYWPRMRESVEQHCRRCNRCLQRKTLPTRAAPMAHLKSSGPMDLVCMDFLCIEPDSRGVSNVLVITDHYTRYAQAFPTKDQKAVTVARVLWEKYFIHYGLPNRLHSDQGRDFESTLIRELLTLLNIAKSRTTPYHPEGDALPERFNRTLLDMLGTLTSPKKTEWSKHVEALVHAYNCTRHESTGYTPYFLMFGREARLPVDVRLRISTDGVSNRTHFRYVQRLRDSLQLAYRLAERTTAKLNAGNKRRYDHKVRHKEIHPGDAVLLRNLGVPGKHKLADRWREGVYEVESQMPGLPVYRIKDSEGRVKVWHRNHLLPIPQVGTDELEIPATPIDGEVEHTEDGPETVKIATSEDPMEGTSQRGLPAVEASPEGATGKEPFGPNIDQLTPVSQPLDPQSPCFTPQRDCANAEHPSRVEMEIPVETEHSAEEDQPRRSQRNSQPPMRMAYDQFGAPHYEAQQWARHRMQAMMVLFNEMCNLI